VSFSALGEQPDARLLLAAAVKQGPAHAYLFHGPAGVGKRAAARSFAAELLGDERRVVEGTHPDLFLLEALGEMIRIDEVRALHRDLHMRPYEADRRVYLVLDAHLLNDDASDALLKDLEEPPSYAVIVLVADELGPIPPTIRSRCQLVPFRRLPGRVIRELLERRAPELSETEVRALARVSGGRLDRAERLLDPDARARRDELIRVARAVYADDDHDPAEAAGTLLGSAEAVGVSAKAVAEDELARFDLTAREAEQRLRRIQRGAEREELLASLEELASWYRDLVVVAAGAEGAVVHADRLVQLRDDATSGRSADAAGAAELARELWRTLEEFNLNPTLALEALFVELRGAFSGGLSLSSPNTVVP
jgi:DNA polymerase III subunit delta'